MGLWLDFGGKGEDIWWESISVLRIARFRHIWCRSEFWRAV